jgi:hypothetical protein
MQFGINLTRVIVPINIVFGVIGNLLNIIVLTRSILYNYASTHYFLALAFNNLFASSFILISNLFANGYHTDITTFSSFSCKIVRYLIELCTVLSSYFIILASIDRYYISSLNPNRRKLSNVKMARRMIIFTSIFFAILYLNTPILIDLENNDNLECRIRPKNTYYQIYPIIQVFIFNVLAPCLMILFGILAIYNTKHIHVHPVHINNCRRTERQLGFMLLIQVSTFILLNLPICIMYIMLSFLPVTSITSEFLFAMIIGILVQQFSFTTPFLLYIISGHIFRQQLIRFINRRLGRRLDNQIQPTNHIDTNACDRTGSAIVLKHIHRR